ncbi:MAG: VWA domain-containing protein [Deltaproteobacteria bacterium]|nr:VWA domain-containing protein [Deltaproteobacteria bacterium]
MSFLTGAALAIAALAAIPFVAHLLRRRPPRERPFAAAHLVPARPAIARRRRALEDRVLFVIRALCIVGLALLGATPFIECSRLSVVRRRGASVALAIVLDDSLSMRAAWSGRAGGLTRLELARQAARELVAGLGPGDAVALVLAGRPARVALAASGNLGAAQAALGEVGPSDRGTDLAGALALGGELLRQVAQVDRRIVLLSDMAERPQGGGKVPGWGGAQLWAPLPELRADLPNCGVVWADRVGAQVAVHLACAGGARAEAAASTAASAGSATPPASARASAAATPGSASAPPRRVQIRAGDKILVEAPVRVREGPSDLVLALAAGSPAAPGAVLDAALTAGDALAEDDRAPVASAGAETRAGVVSDAARNRTATGGAPPVEQAFAALAVQIQPLAAVPEQGAELDPLGALVVDDPPGFTPEARRALDGWARRGGVLLLALGPTAAAAPLGAGFAPLLPALVRWRATPSRKARIELGDGVPLGESAASLQQISPAGRAQLDLQRDDGLEVLGRFDDGAPFLLRRRIGRGVMYALALPLDLEQSDLVLRPGFLGLLAHLVETARGLGGAARTPVGATWSFEGYPEVQVVRLWPGGPGAPLLLAGQAGAWRFSPSRLGLYELRLGEQTARRVAAIDEAEIDLAPRLPLEGGAEAASGARPAPVDVSSYVALGLLALLLGELGLLALDQRRRRAPAGR